MEAGLVALIGLGGLYTISNQNNKEAFKTNSKNSNNRIHLLTIILLNQQKIWQQM